MSGRKIERIRFKIGNKMFPEVSVEEAIRSAEEQSKYRREIADKIRKNPRETKVCGTCEYYNPKVIMDDVDSAGNCTIYRTWKEFYESCKRWKWDGIE